MRLIVTAGDNAPVEADDAMLAGSPHRQVWHTLLALPVGSTIALTVPNDQTPIVILGSDPVIPAPFTVTTYQSLDDES